MVSTVLKTMLNVIFEWIFLEKIVKHLAEKNAINDCIMQIVYWESIGRKMICFEWPILYK